MNGFENIQIKLNGYIKKYYTKQLIKGLLLFLSIGLLIVLLVTGVEYFLWLGSSTRLVLLALLVCGLLVLGYYYIVVPLLYFFKLKKGISEREASVLIGKHFGEVGDRLVNLLDLNSDKEQTDLLSAAIDQKSEGLGNIPFVHAIKLKDSVGYAKYLLLPLAVVLVLLVTGEITEFFGSYKRVVNYDTAYTPPAPFEYDLLTNDLTLLENEALTLELVVTGDIIPDNVTLNYNGRLLLMQQREGMFHYTLEPPLLSGEFYFTANGYDSKVYTVAVGNIPVITGFEMQLDYPKYLNKKNEVVKGTGNAIVPEGTKVTWNIRGLHTEKVVYADKDTVRVLDREENSFKLKDKLFGNRSYSLTTGNENVLEYEKLQYEVAVDKDEHPSIKVSRERDSLLPNTAYYSGIVTDDIGIKEVALVYYRKGEGKNTQRFNILKGSGNLAEFFYTFPTGLDLEAGVDYELYFEVVDNDGLRNGKKTRSESFSTQILDDKILRDKELDAQHGILKKLDRSLGEYDKQQEVLKEINRQQKEDRSLDFNKQNSIKQFLQKQELQESMMEKFSKQLNKSLEKNESDNELKKLLQERLERQERQAAKNKKLLEELNKIADKIDKEDLKKRLEKLGKNQSTNKRNLEQLVELTKRFYVTEKASQLAKNLEELARKQDGLSEQEKLDGLERELQKELNRDFEEIAKELEELEKDNRSLKKPLKLDIDDRKKEGVIRDQNDALEELDKQHGDEKSERGDNKDSQGNRAKEKQKSAAQKIKEMSEALQQGASGGGGSSITEDAEMLRQILDNLITFSFKQENLFDRLQEAEGGIAQFSETIKNQKELRGLFEHVDDSLFALSLRRAELSEIVNENITEVYYNIDRSLESIAENKLFQGASYQQYVLTASNMLADFLAKLLDNMQQSMQSGKGQGQGDGFQLPDIIKGQQELGEKMGQGKKPGEKGQSGEEGQEGEAGEKGQEGQGQKGKGEQSGEEGGQGAEGENGKNSEGGADKDGKGRKGKGKEGKQGVKDGEGNGDEEGKGAPGSGPSEEELKEIFEIYKEQQAIRQKLEQQLNNIIQSDKRNLAKKLVRQMESFENDLLENGITNRTLNKMNTIQHQLLKLENAALKQGEKKERESKTNLKEYQNPKTAKVKPVDKKGTVEILDRQALPLRQNLQKRVKVYFKGEN